jgi:hypothetical protein
MSGLSKMSPKAIHLNKPSFFIHMRRYFFVTDSTGTLNSKSVYLISVLCTWKEAAV